MAAVIGVCERCELPGVRLEKHHMRLRSQGGHDGPTAMLCLICHANVHAHTAKDWREWILRRGEEKPERPIQF